MKCVVMDGTLKYGLEKESRLYQVGEEVDISKTDYVSLQHMLKPIEAVRAERQAKKIIDNSKKSK